MTTNPYPCILCNPDVRNEDGLDVLCNKHLDEATVLDGRHLSALLKHIACQDSLTMLPYVLNPVSVRGIRCWWSWLLDYPFLVREQHASSNYFEFSAQHATHFRTMLASIRRALTARPDWTTAPNPAIAFFEITRVDWSVWPQLDNVWWSCEVLTRLQPRPTAPTEQEIASMSDLALRAQLPPEEVPNAVFAIAHLALR